jgi:predicted ABC-type sugar transport system permease subunit
MSTIKAEPARDVSSAARPQRFDWVRFAEAYALLAGIVVLGAIFGVLRPATFLSWANITTILGSQAVLVVLTLALIIPLTAGDYDLSVASVLTVSGMIVAVLNAQHDWPLGGAMLVALAAGIVTGLVNAGFILYFRIPSLIVTLGSGTFINGVVLWMSGSMTVSGVSPELTEWVVIRRLFGIPLAFYYALALCVLLWYFFEYTTAGQRLLFVGRGREVARLSGVRVDRTRLLSLVAFGPVERGCRHPLRRHDRRCRSAVRPYLPVAGICRRLSGSNQYFARALQSMGLVRRCLFPCHRHHRPDDSRHRDLRAEPILWRWSGTVSGALAART